MSTATDAPLRLNSTAGSALWRRWTIRGLARVLTVAALLGGAGEAAAQNFIVNGDFENTTATGCAFNLTNPSFNALMSDSTAFGKGEIDIMQGGCGYGPAPQSGSYKLGIAGTSDSSYDAFSFVLSTPVAAGSSYDLSFYAIDPYTDGPPTIEIGLSTSPTSLGTSVYSAVVTNTANWAAYAGSFTAPITASYLTVTLSTPRWAHIDNFCLSPAGGGSCLAGPPIPTGTSTPEPTATATPTETPTAAPTLTPTLPNGCANGPILGCRAAQKSRLLIKHGLGTSDRLVYKWAKGAALMQGELADPTATTSYRACMYHGAGNQFLESLAIPPGGSRWRAIPEHGYLFRDSLAANDGVSKLLLKGDAVAGKSKVLLKGKGTNLPHPAAGDILLPVTVQLINPDSGVCVESVFNSAAVRTSTVLRAKTP